MPFRGGSNARNALVADDVTASFNGNQLTIRGRFTAMACSQPMLSFRLDDHVITVGVRRMAPPMEIAARIAEQLPVGYGVSTTILPYRPGPGAVAPVRMEFVSGIRIQQS